SNEERGKLVTRIQTAVKSVANSQDIDLVVDANAVAYNSRRISLKLKGLTPIEYRNQTYMPRV
ncbi:IS3 family transposase, partial [Escherichia coli]|uniref:IS3 family transposase n=1 Tax=Escherichia coli TaxID=562 RepID=UPI003D219641